MHLEQKLAKLLIDGRLTLSAAESCTGGLLGDLLTNIPGSSAFFMLGIIAYDNSAKVKTLKIAPSIIKENGAVSQEVALAMALGVRKVLPTHLGVGITGVAGPSGGTKLKPVGLVFIAATDGKKKLVKKFHFSGSRLRIKRQAAQAAIQLLLDLLQK